MADRFDLAVIGGGPGGYVAALRAAQYGLGVVLIEKEHLGGVCLNWGCIPTKALLASANTLAISARADEFGVRVAGADADVPAMFARKDSVVSKLRRGVGVLLEKRGVAVCSGVATLKGPGSVVVEGSDGTTTIESDNVILATGSGPLVPKSFPYDGRIVVTSKEVLSAPTVPESVLIVGAGSVGCEFAGFYASLGAKVVLVEMLPDLLPGEDRTASRLLKASFAKQGIDVHLGAKVESIEQRSGKAMTSLSDGKDVETDLVLLAMGRRPASDGSGIAESGVATEHGAVVVNDRMETSVEGVYAIGDLVGGWLLAHVASREGVVAAAQAAGRDVRMSYRAVPRCTFTRPEIASVGVTEDQAKERGLKFDTGRFPFSASGRALAAGENQGFVKLVSDSEGGKVIGGVIAGPHAGDLIHEITLAVECGLSVTDLSEMIHAHPTFAESVMEAAESVRGLSIHSM